jgi:putative hemolysin
MFNALKRASLAASLMLLAACAQPASDPPQTGARAVGMANPASVHCGKLGGTSEIRTGPGGQYGMCKLPDGKVCEEWALYRDQVCKDQPAT